MDTERGSTPGATIRKKNQFSFALTKTEDKKSWQNSKKSKAPRRKGKKSILCWIDEKKKIFLHCDDYFCSARNALFGVKKTRTKAKCVNRFSPLPTDTKSRKCFTSAAKIRKVKRNLENYREDLMHKKKVYREAFLKAKKEWRKSVLGLKIKRKKEKEKISKWDKESGNKS